MTTLEVASPRTYPSLEDCALLNAPPREKQTEAIAALFESQHPHRHAPDRRQPWQRP